MASIFTKIIKGEIPAHIIEENERFMAFLDVNPLREGHTLVIPKKEIDYIFNVPDEDLGDMMLFAKKIAAKIEKVFPCERIGVTVIGLEVPHAHIHLIPINSLHDMDFKQKKLSIPQDRMKEIAEKIKKA